MVDGLNHDIKGSRCLVMKLRESSEAARSRDPKNERGNTRQTRLLTTTITICKTSGFKAGSEQRPRCRA